MVFQEVLAKGFRHQFLLGALPGFLPLSGALPVFFLDVQNLWEILEDSNLGRGMCIAGFWDLQSWEPKAPPPMPPPPRSKALLRDY